MYATVESTPPLTKKKMLRSPAVRRIWSSNASDLPGRVPVLLASADVEQKIRQDLVAPRSVNHFGMELDGVQLPAIVAAMAAISHVSVRPSTRNPARYALDDIPMAHPDLLRTFDRTERSARNP